MNIWFILLLANELLRRGESWLDTKKGLVFPKQLSILMVHGTGDRLTAPDASKKAFERLENESKKYISYEGAFHECNKIFFHEYLISSILIYSTSGAEQR